MQSWSRVIEANGVSVEMIADFEVPNCAAIFFNGEEKYRFTDDMIRNGSLSVASQRLAAGERISRRIQSDCPVEIYAAETPDIIIRYGSNITYNMDDVVSSIERRGVSAIAVNDLDDPNCAAIIYDGEERFRYTQESIKNGELGAIARRLGLGKGIPFSAVSDCP